MKFLLWGPACFQEWTVSFLGGPKWSRLCFNDVHGKMWRLWPYQTSEQEAIGNWDSRYLALKMWCCSLELQSFKKQKSKLEICLWPFLLREGDSCFGHETLKAWIPESMGGGLFWHQYYMSHFFFGRGVVSAFSSRGCYTIWVLCFGLISLWSSPDASCKWKKRLPTVLGKGTGSDSPNDSFGSPSFWDDQR